MLAAAAKRTKRTLFDDPYRTLVSNSNKCNHNNIKKPTVFASLHSKLWMTMSSNARPLGGRVTLFFFLVSYMSTNTFDFQCLSNMSFPLAKSFHLLQQFRLLLYVVLVIAATLREVPMSSLGTARLCW